MSVSRHTPAKHVRSLRFQKSLLRLTRLGGPVPPSTVHPAAEQNLDSLARAVRLAPARPDGPAR
jgi:hypothetical protein